MIRGGGDGGENSSTHAEGSAAAAALRKGPWSAAEDAILVGYVREHGEGKWNSVQKSSGLARCGKSCRLRWANHLRPNLKKGTFTPEEEMLILQLHAQLGNRWARMAERMPGRTDNEIKNYWNARIKRRRRAGSPPHPPRTSSVRPPPPMVPSAPSPPLPRSPLRRPFNQPASPNPLMPGSPGFKGIGDDGLTFRFPIGSSYMHRRRQLRQTEVAAAAATMNNMFQYIDDTGYGSSGNFNEMNLNPMMSMAELPSTQLYNNGDGGCGLMDALLQEQGRGGSFFTDQHPIDNENGSNNGDERDLFVDEFPKFEESRCSNDMKRKLSEMEEANPESTHGNISKLIDMISTPVMPPPPEGQTLTTIDSIEISNGGQPSVVTDIELRLELQRLASPLSPAEQEWNIGSRPWNNMPGIG